MASGVVKVERTRWRRAVLLAAAGLLLLFGSIQPSSCCRDVPAPQPPVEDHDGDDADPIDDAPPAGMYPPCFEDERAALLGIKAELNDPNGVLHGWSLDPKVCPCYYWEGVHCNDDQNYHVTHLYLDNGGLSGTLSPRIGDLTSLQKLVLTGNAISGPIPDTIGRLEQLTELDVSNNSFNGSIPSSLGDLKHLSQMKLNNNSLSGLVPDSFGALQATLDLSFNNLSGPLPSNLSSGALDLIGNPLICGADSGDTCSHNQNSKAWPHHGTAITRRVSIICAVAVSSIIPVVGILL